ncbi:hypothetical protein B7494_g4295 [Chlorociboria aeruginascens]|nr:hypothetical protein B7494_g4295 [Chlorociboria aeruginascens]
MPSFFNFQQGLESRGPNNDTSPLLGRFRAVPDVQRNRNRSSLFNSLTPRGYIQSFGDFEGSETDADDAQGLLRRWGSKFRDLWLEPKQYAVARTVDSWWSRWSVLVVLPAGLAVAWCAIPFPQYDLPDDDDLIFALDRGSQGHKVPGHGEARVEVNFWFFLFVYYGFYNFIALMWITKVFNIYSLNW